jgi:hypothetical protein
LTFAPSRAICVAATAGFLAVAAPQAASAQPAPPATWSVGEPTGTDRTVIHGITDAPCTVPGRAGQAVDGFNVVVAGPGGFAPDAAHGRPEGDIVVQTTDTGFSTTAPIPFTFRVSFRDLADELGTLLVPGDYVATVRCVNQFDGVIYQRFSQTFQFSGDPGAMTYRVVSPSAGHVVPGAGAGAPAPAPPVANPIGEKPPAQPQPAVPAAAWWAAGALAVGLAAGLALRRPFRRRDREPAGRS